MLSTLTSAICSLFSYESLSYSIPQLSQASFNATNPFSIYSALLFVIIFISGCGLVSLQMGRVVSKTFSGTVAAGFTDVHMKLIQGHNLNQKGKPPEDSKTYKSFRTIQAKRISQLQLQNQKCPLNDHQKTRRRIYNVLEVDDPACFSTKDVAIENNFNQILRSNLNGSLKKLPIVSPRSPLASGQCSKLDLIKKSAANNAEKCKNFEFSLLKSIITT